MLQDETSHEKEGQRGLGVRYFPGLDEPERLGKRFWSYFDELVRLPRVLVGSEVGCQKKVNALVRKTRRCPYSSKTLDASRFHTHFL